MAMRCCSVAGAHSRFPEQFRCVGANQSDAGRMAGGWRVAAVVRLIYPLALADHERLDRTHLKKVVDFIDWTQETLT